jgi:hypothetical protein
MNGTISNSLSIKSISVSESMIDAHFFNSSSFLKIKPNEYKGWQLVMDKPIAQIFFHMVNKVAISGYQSTFGSFDVAKNLLENELKWFLDSLINELRNLGVQKIKIKHFPSYFINSSLIEHVLIKYGFQNILTETNQHIIIDNPYFEAVANRSEVLRSNKCKKLGYYFRIASLDELPKVYELIENTLSRNGNIPSMSFVNLRKVIEACPENYLLFTLWDKEELIAATVSIKVCDSILYNFYHADHLKYRQVSALTYLLKNIYLYCLENDFKILDLGISSVNGVLNKGLFNFKKGRGAISSTKNYYNLYL